MPSDPPRTMNTILVSLDAMRSTVNVVAPMFSKERSDGTRSNHNVPGIWSVKMVVLEISISDHKVSLSSDHKAHVLKSSVFLTKRTLKALPKIPFIVCLTDYLTMGCSICNVKFRSSQRTLIEPDMENRLFVVCSRSNAYGIPI